jgi:MGT family glycosyltransferase
VTPQTSPIEATLVTWEGGGATQPMLGLARKLAERGHAVRVFAPRGLAERVAAAGARHVPWPAALEFDASRGRAVEDQFSYLDDLIIGEGLPKAVLGELDRDRPDVLVVDCLLRGTAGLGEAVGTPTVLLFHMRHAFIGFAEGDGEGEWEWRWQFRKLNRLRAELGAPALEVPNPGPEATSTSVALARRATSAVVVMPREFDDWGADAPPNLVHVGPIFEEAEPPRWECPWPPSDRRPLVVVTLGSDYMHQEDLLQRISSALAPLPVRSLVLTGLALDPEELSLDPQVKVQRFVPHSAVFPSADLVLAHGGMGTAMAAFAAGLPMVCIPMGRDQAVNAEQIKSLSAGITLERDSGEDRIRAAVLGALDSNALRDGARRMAAVVAGYGGAKAAADAVEEAAESHMPSPW